MTLFLKNESGIELEPSLQADYEAVVGETLREFGCPFGAEVNLLLVDAKEIRSLNKEHRGIDSVTDVLSFPLIEFESPGDFSGISDGDPGLIDPENGELILGDIVICPERAKEQALEYGHSERRELAFLIAHSMLHLLGFDHETKEEEEEMCGFQEKILNNLGISR